MLWIGRKTGEYLKQPFDFHECPSCGFITVHPFVGYEIYDENYYAGRGPDPYVDYATEYRDFQTTDRALEFADLLRVARDYFERRPPRHTIDWLDYGCGAGGLLQFLRATATVDLHGRRVPLRVAGNDLGVYATRLREQRGLTIYDCEQLGTCRTPRWTSSA